VLAAGAGTRPRGLLPETSDDLKEIGGIGPVNEDWLHKQGIYYFYQIASWTPPEAAWVAANLPNFGGRVYRENWMAQSARLAKGEMTEAKTKYMRGDHV
jgi:predicted flap endonuclease-1-like 5' DNA nuclease